MDKLSDSQENILAYILGGVTTQKKLAKVLDKSIHYIKYHLSEMYRKTESKSMVELVVWAYKRREARNDNNL